MTMGNFLKDAIVALLGLLVLVALLAWLAFYAQLHAQAPATETATVDLNGTGIFYIVVRAVDSAGMQSGNSNMVTVNCGTAITVCTRKFLWDANSETPTAYVLLWGRVAGTWTGQQSFAPGSVNVPGRLPSPSLRIRVAE